jgi:hypothetical protein
MLRHCQWRSTIGFEPHHADVAPPPHHSSWRCTAFCVATVNGDAKKGYFFEIVSAKVYYLKSFQVWVNFV